MSMSTPAAGASATTASWYLRLHRVLMPDYNRTAAIYWYTVVLLGGATLACCAVVVAAEPRASWLGTAFGVAVAMLAAVFPVRIPRSKNSLAAGEIFVFLLLLLQGPAAATLAAAGEAAVGSYRTSKRWTSRIASPAMATLAMLASGSLLQALRGSLEALELNNGGLLVVASIVFALAYFVCNTLLVSAVPRLKRNEALQLSDLMGVFGWLGIVYAGSAAVAALLYLAFRQAGVGVLMAVVPIIGLLLMTLHYFFRQEEAHEAARRTASDAAVREAEVTERHLQALRASERRFHSAFTHASIGMALLSLEGKVLQGNAALHAFLGEKEPGLVDHGIESFVSEEYVGPLREKLKLLNAHESEAFEIELHFRRKDGTHLWAATHGSYFSDPGSGAPCLILQVQDITARREAEAGLHHIAFHDALTGLPNRRKFNQCLEAAIERVKTDTERCFALMFLDFDRFKLINDSLGHSAGDEFLVQVAQRIQQTVRSTDIVARLGGDEFAILAEDHENEQQAVDLAERLMRALQQPFMVGGSDVTVSASIGITFSGIGYNTPDEALRDADIAMYKAKEGGKARYALFDASLHAEIGQRLRIERDLRNAIANGELAVVYQPIFDLRSAELIGFEALSRWNHPKLGSIRPEVFIPIAEESELIIALTDFVLHHACHQLKSWQLKDEAFADLRVHVNVSARDIVHDALGPRITQAIFQAQLQPHHLALELTENILMEHIQNSLPTLARLQHLGIGLSLDDFGTGYSSLAHLSNLPINTLKVDRSFVRDLQSGSKEAKVVRAIVRLGVSLDKSIVAEGIENALQLAQLRDMGCTRGQGFHLGRPQSAEAIDTLLERILAQQALGLGHTSLGDAAVLH
jgi:diguanylate cyclase (GGDEF)-like protein/PAS domain S-box-containing protein